MRSIEKSNLLEDLKSKVQRLSAFAKVKINKDEAALDLEDYALLILASPQKQFADKELDLSSEADLSPNATSTLCSPITV